MQPNTVTIEITITVKVSQHRLKITTATGVTVSKGALKSVTPQGVFFIPVSFNICIYKLVYLPCCLVFMQCVSVFLLTVYFL